MFVLVGMLEVYPRQQQFLEEHMQEGGQLQRARMQGKLSGSTGNALRFASLLTASFIAVPIAKPMPDNIFALRAHPPLQSLQNFKCVMRIIPCFFFSVLFMRMFN